MGQLARRKQHSDYLHDVSIPKQSDEIISGGRVEGDKENYLECSFLFCFIIGKFQTYTKVEQMK